LAGATDIDQGETTTLSIANLLYAVDGGAASAMLPAGFSLGIDGHTLTIDPADPAFDYLAFNQQTVIEVSYDVMDAQGATVPQTETVTITGTNDGPVVAAALTATADEGDTAFATDLLAGATDLDLGETATLSIANLLYSINGGTASAILPAGFSLGIDGHTLTIDPADPAFDLASGDQTAIVVSYDVEDAQGATVPQTATVTIHGHDLLI
jgi:VCBS repeat-containing protein